MKALCLTYEQSLVQGTAISSFTEVRDKNAHTWVHTTIYITQTRMQGSTARLIKAHGMAASRSSNTNPRNQTRECDKTDPSQSHTIAHITPYSSSSEAQRQCLWVANAASAASGMRQVRNWWNIDAQGQWIIHDATVINPSNQTIHNLYHWPKHISKWHAIMHWSPQWTMTAVVSYQRYGDISAIPSTVHAMLVSCIVTCMRSCIIAVTNRYTVS